MAGRIRDADIALVREASAIAEVIGEYVSLRPAGGGQLRGLCPFHDEKTPSFNVRPHVGAYHCFGCGEGGDVIAFVRAVDHLSFPEAVERLARRANITLTYEGGGAAARSATSLRQRLVDAHRAAAEFYAAALASPDARAGRDFLSERGFDRAAAERFQVGYAPSGWDQLSRHLLGLRFTREELISGGLAKDGNRGGLIDRFHRRLVWPIRDLAGDVVGFGARKLAADDPGPKYLNTPETTLFKKGSLLYGADLARREIARSYQVVVVEGYTDVMACHLAGVPTAVATCGTAFGPEHVGVMRRLLMDQDEHRGEVIFTFDGDAAGRKAALRAMEFDQRFASQTFVAVEPTGLDPCELRTTRGDTAVRDLIAHRVRLFEFAIRARLDDYDLEHPEGRVAALRAAAPLVSGMREVGLRDEYARRLAGWIGMEVEVVLGRVRELRGEALAGANGGGPQARAPRRPAGAPTPVDATAALVEREALKIALQYPALAGPVFDAAGEEVFTAPEHRAVHASVVGAGGVAAAAAVPAWVAAVAEGAADDEVRKLVTALAVEPLRFDGAEEDRYVAAVLSRLQELAVTRRIAALKSRVQRLNPVTDTEVFNRAYGELIALEQHKRLLRERGMGVA